MDRRTQEQKLLEIWVSAQKALFTKSEFDMITESLRRGSTPSGIPVTLPSLKRLFKFAEVENALRGVAPLLARISQTQRDAAREGTASIYWLLSHMMDANLLPDPLFAQNGSKANELFVDTLEVTEAIPWVDKVTDFLKKEATELLFAYVKKIAEQLVLEMTDVDISTEKNFDLEWLIKMSSVFTENPD